MHAVPDRHGLVKHRSRRARAHGTPLSYPTAANVLWCADYKGEFLLGNHRYCYPLTITDFASRHLLPRSRGTRVTRARLDRHHHDVRPHLFQRRKIKVSQVFAGQTVGVKQTDEHIWLVSFMYYDSGYFDDETWRLEPIDNPFGPILLPMSPE